MALSAADKARKRESMRLWIKAGGDPKEAGRAGAVSLAESGGSDKATNNNTNGTKDRGRWQINSIHGALSTHDPIGNARAAVKLSKNGRDWSPWVAYNTGAYRKFTGSVGGSGSTSGSGKSGSSTHRSASAATTTTTTSTTTPGVDNRAARAAAISAFLGSKRADPLDFALSMRGLQDVAPSTSTKTTTAGGSSGGGSRRPTTTTAVGGYPLARRGKLIGAPHQGTHTLGNWQSDNAIDISVPVGTPLLAPQNAVVVKVKRRPQSAGRFAGDQVTLRGANGEMYFYAHGTTNGSVKPGTRLRAGQQFGRSGSANGVAHLHIGVSKGDPRKQFR